MASFSFSKWLICALALLALALIRTSHGSKCHWCGSNKDVCFPRTCPDENFFRTFVFPANKDVDVACYIDRKVDDKKDIVQLCTPFGKRWAALIGGQDKCRTLVRNDDVKQLESEESNEWKNMLREMDKVEEEVERLQKARLDIPRDLLLKQGLILALESTWRLEQQKPKAQSRAAADDDEKFDTCICKKDLCNEEKAFEQKSGAVSGREFRIKAIIVLPVFACIIIACRF